MQDQEEIKLPWVVPEAPPPPRNAPCPCGSGLKYKKCHLPKDEAGEPCDNSFWEMEEINKEKNV